MADCPDGFWIRVVFHIAEIFETFGVVTVASNEVVFVDFEDVGEEAEKREEDVVMDVLNPDILASPNKCCAVCEH